MGLSPVELVWLKGTCFDKTATLENHGGVVQIENGLTRFCASSEGF
jgi:hypothetical protein